jgi:hypothetical protein
MVTAAQPARPPHMNDSNIPIGLGAMAVGAAELDMLFCIRVLDDVQN